MPIADSSYSFGVQMQQVDEHAPAVSYFLMGLRIRPWNLKGWLKIDNQLSEAEN